MTRSALLLAIASVTMSALAQVLLKAGMAAPAVSALADAGTRASHLVAALTHPLVLLGLGLYGASAVVWLLVLARLDVSMAYPIVALGFVLTAMLGWWIHGESVSAMRWVGIVVITVGVVIVARS
jgi:multidrug transporter EmrE-like cation transporter